MSIEGKFGRTSFELAGLRHQGLTQLLLTITAFRAQIAMLCWWLNSRARLPRSKNVVDASANR